MKQLYRLSRKIISNSRGFTFPELMTVLFIIAILVAIAIPIYTEATGHVELRTCQANLRTLDGASNQFRMEHDRFPDDYKEFENAGLVQEMPTCPTSGEHYTDYDSDTGRFSCSIEGHKYPED